MSHNKCWIHDTYSLPSIYSFTSLLLHAAWISLLTKWISYDKHHTWISYFWSETSLRRRSFGLHSPIKYSEWIWTIGRFLLSFNWGFTRRADGLLKLLSIVQHNFNLRFDDELPRSLAPNHFKWFNCNDWLLLDCDIGVGFAFYSSKYYLKLIVLLTVPWFLFNFTFELCYFTKCWSNIAMGVMNDFKIWIVFSVLSITRLLIGCRMQ